MAASAQVRASAASGRMEFQDVSVRRRAEPVFTPLRGEQLDLGAIGALIDGWLAEAGLAPGDVFAGGAIVTGLAARRRNARGLTALVSERLGEAVIATADDPALESWLAFMGSAAALSREHPERPVLNLDVGGGTTNSAVGLDGQVVATGCHALGARHLRFAPGTRRLVGVSPHGEALLAKLGIAGPELSEAEVAAVVAWQVAALEAIAAGEPAPGEQLALRLPDGVGDPIVVFSGGVGELVYAAQRPAGPAHYGDLGGELAAGILDSESLARSTSPRSCPSTAAARRCTA